VVHGRIQKGIRNKWGLDFFDMALEKEGTVITEPYGGAVVKPLSAEEVSDIAELKLALITLAAKPAYRHLSPTDFDLA